MKNYTIIINGWNEDTEIEMVLNEQEADLIERLGKLSVKNADHEFNPTLEIRKGGYAFPVGSIGSGSLLVPPYG